MGIYFKLGNKKILKEGKKLWEEKLLQQGGQIRSFKED